MKRKRPGNAWRQRGIRKISLLKISSAAINGIAWRRNIGQRNMTNHRGGRHRNGEAQWRVATTSKALALAATRAENGGANAAVRSNGIWRSNEKHQSESMARSKPRHQSGGNVAKQIEANQAAHQPNVTKKARNYPARRPSRSIKTSPMQKRSPEKPAYSARKHGDGAAKERVTPAKAASNEAGRPRCNGENQPRSSDLGADMA